MPRNSRKKARWSKKEPLSVKNAKAIKKLKKLPEVKHRDNQYGELDFDSDGDIHFLTTLPQGVGQEQRVGGSVRCTMIQIRGYIKEQGAGSDGIGRIIVFRVKEKAAATTIASTTVLESVNVVAHYVRENMPNIKVYYDETFPFDTTQHSNIPFKITIKPNTLMQYNDDAAGNENDQTKSPMYALLLSNVATGADCPHYYLNVRMWFTDS